MTDRFAIRDERGLRKSITRREPEVFQHHRRHPWAQPGDRPERVWILRFDDADRREMIWTGEDAEAEATAAYRLFSPTWNCTLLATVPAAEVTP